MTTRETIAKYLLDNKWVEGIEDPFDHYRYYGNLNINIRLYDTKLKIDIYRNTDVWFDPPIKEITLSFADPELLNVLESLEPHE